MRNRPSLQARLLDQVERAPDRRAIGFMSSDASVAWRTRAGFYQTAAGYAVALQEQGLRRGDVCVIVLPSQEFSAQVLLATLLAGALPLLVAPPVLLGTNSNLAAVLERTVRRTSARVVVCDPSLAGLVGERSGRRFATRYVFGSEALAPGAASRFQPVIPDDEALAALQLTSGTTGFPRICMWRQAGVVAALDAMGPAMGLTADDICLNWTPLYHDMGLVNNYLLCMTMGVPLVMMTPQDFVKRPSLWLRGLTNTGATHTWSPNFGFALAAARVRDSELQGIRLEGVKAFWNAAERIHLDTLVQFRKRFEPYGLRPAALKTNFGCAENVGGATFSDPDGDYICEHVDRAALHDRGIALTVDESVNGGRAVSVVSAGRPAPGLDVVILGRGGEPLPEGRVGELALRTPSRMLGYLQNARATRRALHGELLRTGDLAYVRGGEVFWVGRVRERITLAGKKLDPSDFERVLLEVPGLRPGCFAAFGVDDGVRGTQRVVVVSEVRDDDVPDLTELSDAVRRSVNLGLGIEVGDVVLVTKGTLTKTSSGKRRHRHFRELYANGALAQFRLQRRDDAVAATAAR